MDKELKKIIEKYANCSRKNVFSKYKKEILILKENCVTLKKILEYLFTKDKELKKRYENRVDTALAHLSRTIRNWKKKEIQKSNVKEEKVSNNNPVPKENPNPKKEVQDEKNKLDLKKDINTKSEDNTIDEDMMDLLNVYKQTQN